MDEKVMVVEDDGSVRETTAALLEGAGLQVTAVDDGRAALDTFAQQRFDLIVLDVMLPSVDGFTVCREVRKVSQVPIVMLTARTESTDIVAGLELGADDYITKPFDAAVLVARVRAALRRHLTDEETAVIRCGGLEIDVEGFRASRDGDPVELTSTEFRLLVELARRPGRVLSRGVLLGKVWGYDYLGDSRLVDMAVKRLRDKLGDDPREPSYISTVRGAGYRFDRS